MAAMLDRTRKESRESDSKAAWRRLSGLYLEVR